MIPSPLHFWGGQIIDRWVAFPTYEFFSVWYLKTLTSWNPLGVPKLEVTRFPLLEFQGPHQNPHPKKKHKELPGIFFFWGGGGTFRFSAPCASCRWSWLAYEYQNRPFSQCYHPHWSTNASEHEPRKKKLKKNSETFHGSSWLFFKGILGSLFHGFWNNPHMEKVPPAVWDWWRGRNLQVRSFDFAFFSKWRRRNLTNVRCFFFPHGKIKECPVKWHHFKRKCHLPSIN